MLQTAGSFKKKALCIKDIDDISGVVPHYEITKIEKTLISKGDFKDIQELCQELILEGYDVQQLLIQLLEHIAESKLPCLVKAKVSEIIADTDVKVI